MILTHLPQSEPIANKIIIGDINNINKIKKFEKKFLNIILLTILEFFDNKKSGPKPIRMTKKYLINITELYRGKFAVNCDLIVDLDNNKAQDI